MSKSHIISVLIFSMVSLFANPVFAQGLPSAPVSESSTDSTTYMTMSAETLLHNEVDGDQIDTLIGNVELLQDSIFMSCDRAVITNEINAVGTGNVVIIHQDTVYIYADDVDYDGISRVAILTGEVILVQGDKELHTNRLVYDVNTKKATFLTGGTLIENGSVLKSKEGYYDANAETARFKINVSLVDSNRTVLTDSLLFHYNINRLDIISPTIITQDSTEIYCEEGLYFLDSENAVLQTNVQVKNQGRVIKSNVLHYDGDEKLYTFLINPTIVDSNSVANADTILYQSETEVLELRNNANYKSETQDISSRVIVYDNKLNTYRTVGESTVYDQDVVLTASEITKNENGETIATGPNVTLIDTSNHTTIICQRLIRSDSSDLTKAYNLIGQPVLLREMESDTLYLMADTLLSFSFTDSMGTIDHFSAVDDVRLLKGAVSGIADSLSFSSLDSIFVLYRNPLMWSDSTQLSADTIRIGLRDGDVDQIAMDDNALIVNMDKEGYFNQIAGLNIVNSIVSNSIDNSMVSGNAELIYFVRDDEDEIVGVQSSKSSRMSFAFENDEIQNVRFFKNPENNLYQYEEGTNVEQFRLQNFKWQIEKRPQLFMFERNKKGLTLSIK